MELEEDIVREDTAREASTPKAWPQTTAWMITFTDLVALMLTFFVMLFAMSNVKVDKWELMTDALSQSLNPERVKSEARPTAEYNVPSVYRKRAINLDYLAGVFEETVAGDPTLAGSKVIRLEDRLILALPGDLLFEPGQAVLTERARPTLFNLGGVLRNIENRISVNGHSDPVSAGVGEYATNWELSLARAIAVANALRRAGYTEDIAALGYADSRLFELPSGMDEERRRALARRVDIVIQPTAEGA